MNIKKLSLIFGLIIFALVLNGCANSKFNKKYNKPFKHNTPLIQDKNIVKSGKSEIAKTLEMGPKPTEGDTRKLGKRKKISSETQRNYLIIPDDYPLLKQRVTLKFKNLDYKETMKLMGNIGEINVLVGDEVAGAISAELIDVPWDKAFQALLDMKNYASDVDVVSNLIRVHSPETLTSQETYKSERAQAVKKKVELEDSVEPIYSEIFRLYYISPTQAKTTIEELFTQKQGDSSYTPIQITEEITTRSIIVRGKEKDLDVVDKVIKEIDIRTKQVLIEAFIVEANSDFERALGTRLGGYYKRQGKQMGGVAGTSSAGTFDPISSAALGSTTDAITNFATTGATSGIGILRSTGTMALKAEITALESIGMGKTISNPKVFTLDNQTATVTQGEEIPYQTTSEGTTSTSFKEAALKLEVTPSIIGDGNVLLTIQVNNDTPNRTTDSDEPPINKMEIVTKLLVADGDIVVIGGIKKNVVANSKSQTPGLGNVPVIGNLFKGKSKSDNLDELLVFIAPRIL
ncbi:MAG: pilus assembly protein PilQ [Rhodospirillaceae bacterium]|nr:pilus assembly protein PilQ [Rhodospirillaceae bacterium]